MNRWFRYALLTMLRCSAATVTQTTREEKTLWPPYFISPRPASQQLDLSDAWQLGWRDAQLNSVDELQSQSKWLKARVAATTTQLVEAWNARPIPLN